MFSKVHPYSDGGTKSGIRMRKCFSRVVLKALHLHGDWAARCHLLPHLRKVFSCNQLCSEWGGDSLTLKAMWFR